jgi:hypothetical protein
MNMEPHREDGLVSTEDIKEMSVKEFVDFGLLHEVNRLVLHPVGVALSVNVDSEGTPVSFGIIWDYRDDPEGIAFGDDLLSLEKATRVLEAVLAKRGTRIKELGYVVQPFPGEIALTTNYTSPDGAVPDGV